MNMIEAVKSSFSKYADFSGRARRAEYWWFSLFNMIAGFVVTFGLVFAFAETVEEADLLSNVYTFAVFLPSLAVGVRRLHDTGRSGWWVLLVFTIVGMIPLLIWSLMKGDEGANAYGPDPLDHDGSRSLPDHHAARS